MLMVETEDLDLEENDNQSFINDSLDFNINDDDIYTLINSIVDEKPFMEKSALKLSQMSDPELIKEDLDLTINDKYPVVKLDDLDKDKVCKEHQNKELEGLLFCVEKEFQRILKSHIKVSDLNFIIERYKNTDDFLLEVEQIPSVKVIEDEDYEKIMYSTKLDLNEKWKQVYSRFGQSKFSFSLPIFNKSKDIAIIQVSSNCGSLCAYSGTYVYYRNNNTWERIGVFGGEIVS